MTNGIIPSPFISLFSSSSLNPSSSLLHHSNSVPIYLTHKPFHHYPFPLLLSFLRTLFTSIILIQYDPNHGDKYTYHQIHNRGFVYYHRICRVGCQIVPLFVRTRVLLMDMEGRFRFISGALGIGWIRLGVFLAMMFGNPCDHYLCGRNDDLIICIDALNSRCWSVRFGGLRCFSSSWNC